MKKLDSKSGYDGYVLNAPTHQFFVYIFIQNIHEFKEVFRFLGTIISSCISTFFLFHECFEKKCKQKFAAAGLRWKISDKPEIESLKINVQDWICIQNCWKFECFYYDQNC